MGASLWFGVFYILIKHENALPLYGGSGDGWLVFDDIFSSCVKGIVTAYSEMVK